MSETKFTKGPWECRPDDLAEGLYWVEPEADNEEEDEANAHLIAAAPEMYESLNTLLTRWADGRGFDGSAVAKEMLNAAAILAKARGEQ